MKKAGNLCNLRRRPLRPAAGNGRLERMARRLLDLRGRVTVREIIEYAYADRLLLRREQIKKQGPTATVRHGAMNPARRMRIRNIMPIVRDYSRASQCFLFARLTRAKHDFICRTLGSARHTCRPSRRTAMTPNRAWSLLAAFLVSPLTTASANVVTDWDEKAVALIQSRMVPPVAYRAMAIVHIAMFDAVNSIEPHYRPYYAQLPAPRETSKEAAAAAAAGAVLTKLLPDVASDIQAALQSYLLAIPDNDAKSNGIKLGDAVAAKILEARAADGSSAPDAYRPVTTPGVYIPT